MQENRLEIIFTFARSAVCACSSLVASYHSTDADIMYINFIEREYHMRHLHTQRYLLKASSNID